MKAITKKVLLSIFSFLFIFIFAQEKTVNASSELDFIFNKKNLGSIELLDYIRTSLYPQEKAEDITNKLSSFKNVNTYNANANSESDFIWEETEYGTARIVEYVGTSKDVVIPRHLGGLEVTEIGHINTIGGHGPAFVEKGLTSVVIPDTVQYIGTQAFAFNELTSVIIPDSVIAIGLGAFATNQLTEVKLSENLEILGLSTFANNKITEIVIPDSVLIIGGGDFLGNQLEKVVMSKNIQLIGTLAFAYNNLKEIIIPESIDMISPDAFGLNPLETVVIESDSLVLYYENLDTYYYGFYYDELGLFNDFQTDADISTPLKFLDALTNNQVQLVNFDHLTIYGHENAMDYANRLGYTYIPIEEYQPSNNN